MTRYLARKSLLYLLTFFVAVTIDWAIPRLMPGNPIDGLISRIQADPTASEELHGYFTESFGLDQPLWQQYLNFWRGLLHGDLGPSIAYVGSRVSELIWAALPYTLALLVPAIVLSYILGRTAFGRHIYATGDDPDAARLSGINTDRVLIAVYALAGLICAIGAWALIGRIGGVSPQAGQTANLDSITAVVIGGTSLFGGRGSIIGTLFGALIVGVFRNGLALSGLALLWQDFAVGVLIIVAVTIDQWFRKISS